MMLHNFNNKNFLQFISDKIISNCFTFSYNCMEFFIVLLLKTRFCNLTVKMNDFFRAGDF